MPFPLMPSFVPKFRKFKFGIVLQLTLLMIVLVFLAIWRISSWTSVSARSVVTDHEKIDLQEETQISGWRLLDQLDALRYDLRQAAIVLHDRLAEGKPIDAETAEEALPQRMLSRYVRIGMFQEGDAGEVPLALTRRCEEVSACELGQQWNSLKTVRKYFCFTPEKSLVLVHDLYREKIKLKPQAVEFRRLLAHSENGQGPHVPDTEYHVLWAGIFIRTPRHDADGNAVQPGGWWLLAGLGMDEAFRSIGGSPRHLGLLSVEKTAGGEPTMALYSAAKSRLADGAGRFTRPLGELQPLFVDADATSRLSDFQVRERTNKRLEVTGRPNLLTLPLKPEQTMYFRETEKLKFAEPAAENQERARWILDELNGEFTEQEWQAEAGEPIHFRRVSDLGEVIPRIRLMSDSKAELERMREQIQQRFADQALLQEPLAWRTDPVACRTCLVSQVRITLAPESERLGDLEAEPKQARLLNDSLRRLTLTRLVFEEELTADLDAELAQVNHKAYIGGALAVLAAFFLSLLITRPLKAMIGAAQTIADAVSQPQPSPLPLESHVRKLPLRRPDEIGDLAVAFRHLVHQVQVHATELQERESFLRGIHDNAMDGIMSLDARGMVLSFNPAAERIFGWSAAEIIGRPFETLYPPRVAEELRTNLTRFLASGEAQLMGRHAEVAGLRKDGAIFPLELSISLITQADGELLFVSLLRDLRERKEAERARELMASNEEKSHALREIAHEMLGDLTAIIGAADMYRRRFGEHLLPDQDAYLQRIHHSGSSLVDFLNNLRELARIASGSQSLQCESFNPRETIEDVLNILHARCVSSEHRVYTELDGLPPTLRADKRRFRQVIQNLLDNACKYTPAGGTIRLRGCLEDGQFHFEVSDNGIGIPEQDYDKVLRDFGRASNADSQAQGTGIGLGLCRRILELHGGNLSFESRLHYGSTFRARLPLTPPVPKAGECSGGWGDQSPRPEPLRILVADARPEQSVDLVEFLQEDGHTVDLVINGEHLLSRARDWLPDLVLTVMKFPDMTARELMPRLRNNGEQTLPVILMSRAKIPDVQAMGFVGLLSLPFNHADVRKALQEWPGGAPCATPE